MVKGIREAKGITRYKLAKMTGIPQATLQSMENAVKPNPTFRHLCAIADALGVTLNDLRGGEEGESSSESVRNDCFREVKEFE